MCVRAYRPLPLFQHVALYDQTRWKTFCRREYIFTRSVVIEGQK